MADPRFSVTSEFEEKVASGSQSRHSCSPSSHESLEEAPLDGLEEGMDPDGFSGPSQVVVKPLTKEALVEYKAAQGRVGVIYISRIPPGMRPAKVRHLMSAYGEVGRVYLQQEDPKRAYLRKKYTATKKPHFTEGWVEFKDKKIARSVAEMLNAEPIGGKKGTRWRDDVWTMKYLPKFKWNMLTEQVAHEAALRTAKLRAELSQSRTEQHEYLKNVELARVLDKRTKRRRSAGKEDTSNPEVSQSQKWIHDSGEQTNKRRKKDKDAEETSHNTHASEQLDSVLRSIF